MRAHAHRIALLALFGIWVLLSWQPLSRQFAALEYWKRQFGGRSTIERAELTDYPAFLVSEQVQQFTPNDSCILFLSYTGPEHVNYYKTRFDYYLYPRRVRIFAGTEAPAEDCPYVAVFRDAQRNLAEEPFRGVWNEDQLRRRLEGWEKIHAGPHLELYRRRGAPSP